MALTFSDYKAAAKTFTGSDCDAKDFAKIEEALFELFSMTSKHLCLFAKPVSAAKPSLDDVLKDVKGIKYSIDANGTTVNIDVLDIEPIEKCVWKGETIATAVKKADKADKAMVSKIVYNTIFAIAMGSWNSKVIAMANELSEVVMKIFRTVGRAMKVNITFTESTAHYACEDGKSTVSIPFSYCLKSEKKLEPLKGLTIREYIKYVFAVKNFKCYNASDFSVRVSL